VAGRYPQALEGYRLLSSTHGNSETVRSHRLLIEQGLLAARAGVDGPAALLSVPSDGKNGRIEVEYIFDDASIVERDFTAVQPFASAFPERMEAGGGVVRLSGATGLFHNLVYAADVRLEADVDLPSAKDLGAIAVEDGDAYRAVVLTLNNTQWKLKKGDAATVQPGHVLWFVGEGAWSAADPGVHGFIKIAERAVSKISDGDAGTIEFLRKKDRCEGGFRGKSDGVSLEGTVKGDDGRGMGRAQVGLFTNGGALVVRRIRISGLVDPDWFRARLAELIASDPGPP
jgi:hypothetical protein